MSDLEENVAELEISEKSDQKKKLTHKEKKKLKKQQEYERTIEMMTKQGGAGHSELESNFTVSQSQTPNRNAQQLEHAVDIKVENFSIAAKGKELFTNASLLVAQGRRYGLVGPNGLVQLIFKFKAFTFNFFFSLLNSHGKTTLLRHIAQKKFNIPSNIDILYCEQEVVADETPAVQVVLKADVKCNQLKEECKKLEDLIEKGDTDTCTQDKLQEVIYKNL